MVLQSGCLAQKWRARQTHPHHQIKGKQGIAFHQPYLCNGGSLERGMAVATSTPMPKNVPLEPPDAGPQGTALVCFQSCSSDA